jgi:aldose 1-epimerase
MNPNYKFEVNQDAISLKNNNELIAHIDLINGGSLQYLNLNGFKVIEQKKQFAYADSYASSMLFPFINRLNKGSYSFKNKLYQFPINESGGNAHHGVLFNKKFKLKDYFLKDNEASTILQYDSSGEEGYPFAFKIELDYTFGLQYLNMNINVQNLTTHDIPYSLGWHPYFISSNLSKSSIRFSKEFDIITDKLGVAQNRKEEIKDITINPAEHHLDNCFQLKNGEIKFITPDYKMSIVTNRNPAFVHLYTPKIKDLFAIELTSGISNSLNHGIGLDILSKESSTTMNWKLKIDAVK